MQGDQPELGREGEGALVVHAVRESIELRARRPLDLGSVVAGEARERLELRSVPGRLDQHALELGPVSADGLAHRLEARDQAQGHAPSEDVIPARACSTSAAMARAAASGSAASRMGRPTTIQLAPAAMASRAVIVRF